jgi:hypothetical protein
MLYFFYFCRRVYLFKFNFNISKTQKSEKNSFNREKFISGRSTAVEGSVATREGVGFASFQNGFSTITQSFENLYVPFLVFGHISKKKSLFLSDSRWRLLCKMEAEKQECIILEFAKFLHGNEFLF